MTIEQTTEKLVRPSWEDYFFGFAKQAATRGTCLRGKVGAVLVTKDFNIIGTGYNGAAPGEDHCYDVGCEIVNNHCLTSIHAEQNAIAYCAREGIALRDASMYVYMERHDTNNYSETDGMVKRIKEFPCRTCRALIQAVDIHEVTIRIHDLLAYNKIEQKPTTKTTTTLYIKG